MDSASGAAGWAGGNVLKAGVVGILPDAADSAMIESILKPAVEKTVADKAASKAIEQLIAEVGVDRATEVLASATQSYLETQAVNNGNLTAAAAQAEGRKFAEQVVKMLVP